MPKRTDIKSIAIIGAGPIMIGQACEFDYAGAQACKALREEGYRIVLINSNPATIMTDPEHADATYIEPLTPEILIEILKRERPDALLSTMGGQTSLNNAMILARDGVLDELQIELIGADQHVIEKAENRFLFRQAMEKIGLECPQSYIARSFDQAKEILNTIAFPIIIRPSFTLGGSGGGVAFNFQQFETIVCDGLRTSPIHEVLIEESLLGWKEFELEVMRDKADNCIIVCSIENIDPMGIHTGDSITVTPAMTLTDKEYQRMRNAAIMIIREIGVDTGGVNVQFAVNPRSGRLMVIEMNPRVSRSSALASKATGFPIAKIAAKIAVGYTLDELPNDINKVTPASFEPTIDYVVTKIPRFTFEKFPDSTPLLTTSMKSVGEVMAIGRSFAESLQKALRSLETGLTGFGKIKTIDLDTMTPNRLRETLAKPLPERFLVIAEAFRKHLSLEEIHQACQYDPWFLGQIKKIVEAEETIRCHGLPTTKKAWWEIKQLGFSDAHLAHVSHLQETEIAVRRRSLGIVPVFKRIDTCAGEFASPTPYMYSTYAHDSQIMSECEACPSDRTKVIILGGGPNRIGQGIEFDYCCVHASYALREIGIETIMVNCNPETVSTDYDTSDRLYFEPLTVEDVLELVHVEQRKGHLLGVIVQFGGQTPLKLARALEAAGVTILGTSPDAIDLAEDRDRFKRLIQTLQLRQPLSGMAYSREEAKKIADTIGYPVIIRPSYVLGGRGMEIAFDHQGLYRYIDKAVEVSGHNPVLIDQFLKDAIEIDVDVIADCKPGREDFQEDTVYIAGIMQHIEEAGIHSGDSACTLPPYNLKQETINQIGTQAALLAKALRIVGLENIQMAIQNDVLYILELNPRASRTVPFVAKAIGMPIAKIAARVIAGEPLANFDPPCYQPVYMAVKEAVFSFQRFAEADVLLGPEMKSTGEVMGLDTSFTAAFAKAQIGAGIDLPCTGTVFLSVKQRDKKALVQVAEDLAQMGFVLSATRGTAAYLSEHGLTVQYINKVTEGQPHIIDAIINQEVQLIINTVEGERAVIESRNLRQFALRHNIPYCTTLAGTRATVGAIAALRRAKLEVAPLQSYLAL